MSLTLAPTRAALSGRRLASERGPAPSPGLAPAARGACTSRARGQSITNLRSSPLPGIRASRPGRAQPIGGAREGRMTASFVANALPQALLFDCDGVLVDTERDGHRVSFNIAFKEKGLDLDWSPERYGELLEIGGGKERMTHHFNTTDTWPADWPTDDAERQKLIKELHLRKTDIFMELIEGGSLPLRPGVARLVDEARAAGVKLAVCSTSNEKAVQAVVDVMLGPDRARDFQVYAGDMVKKKKPAPDVYLMAAEKLGVAPDKCWVVEDTHIGLTAAKAAGMNCVVTTSPYTVDEDFAAANFVVPEIGEEGAPKFSLSDLGV